MNTVARAVRVIQVLKDARDGLSLSELAARCEEPISSLHRLLQALLQERVVWQDRRDKRYSLSVDLVEVSHALIRDLRLRQVARPHLERLTAETHKNAYVSIWIQDRVIGVDSVEASGEHSFGLLVPSFQIMPFHCAASAKVILAYQPPDKVAEVLQSYTLTRFTDRTIVDKDALLAHLAGIRARGYALCDQEAQLGVTAAAFPILNANGEVLASVGLCSSTVDFEDDTTATLEALRLAAERISVEWGGYRRFVLT